MYGLSIKTSENKETYVIEKSRFSEELEPKRNYFRRLCGIESAEIINLNTKGIVREPLATDPQD